MPRSALRSQTAVAFLDRSVEQHLRAMFHGNHYSETPGAAICFTVVIPVKHRRTIDAFEAGFVLGLLVGEGHFGGDGRQAQITLRMHLRHEPIFTWLKQRFPYARLYGPYHHGGRSYYQLMWRGPQLQYGLMPWLEALPWAEIDPHTYGRYRAMKERYRLEDVPSLERPHISELPNADADVP